MTNLQEVAKHLAGKHPQKSHGGGRGSSSMSKQDKQELRAGLAESLHTAYGKSGTFMHSRANQTTQLQVRSPKAEVEKKTFSSGAWDKISSNKRTGQYVSADGMIAELRQVGRDKTAITLRFEE